MPLERRIEAAGLFWDDEHSADQQLEAVASIATHMKFRPRSVLGLDPGKRAKYLAQLPTVTDAIVFPIGVALAGHEAGDVAVITVLAVLVVGRHLSNLRRLVKGEELGLDPTQEPGEPDVGDERAAS